MQNIINCNKLKFTVKTRHLFHIVDSFLISTFHKVV